ncbi:hypothetical protein GC387_20600 [Pseudomonas sp. MWU12-2323]|nr:hypothetical protein [Pseudomonas sp. MWU12-2323]RBH54762.1 hypothetical protein C3F00_023145 [Pseudomonas sp. MWU13-2860]
MSNLGIRVSSHLGQGRRVGADAPLIKKCAILAMAEALDQLYAGKCDECCAMLRPMRVAVIFCFKYPMTYKSSATVRKTAHAA